MQGPGFFKFFERQRVCKQFWESNFWADNFWADNFWCGLAANQYIEIVSLESSVTIVKQISGRIK